MTNHHELPTQTPVETTVPLDDLAIDAAEVSSVRRIVRAGIDICRTSGDIFSSIGKIVLNGNAGEAIRESANHL